MGMNETLAYDAFLSSGKIQDYLAYIGVKQEAGEPFSSYTPPTGEDKTSAYHDRRDSAAGACG